MKRTPRVKVRATLPLQFHLLGRIINPDSDVILAAPPKNRSANRTRSAIVRATCPLKRQRIEREHPDQACFCLRRCSSRPNAAAIMASSLSNDWENVPPVVVQALPHHWLAEPVA